VFKPLLGASMVKTYPELQTAQVSADSTPATPAAPAAPEPPAAPTPAAK
jgi:hypothetical protein